MNCGPLMAAGLTEGYMPAGPIGAVFLNHDIEAGLHAVDASMKRKRSRWLSIEHTVGLDVLFYPRNACA